MIEINKKMARALDESIRIWEWRVDNVREADGYQCPLCVQGSVETADTPGDRCGTCPVEKTTGTGCFGTPFFQWSEATRRWAESESEEDRKEAIYAAKREVAFLKKLKSNCKEVE